MIPRKDGADKGGGNGWTFYIPLRRCATPPQGEGEVMPWGDGAGFSGGEKMGEDV